MTFRIPSLLAFLSVAAVTAVVTMRQEIWMGPGQALPSPVAPGVQPAARVAELLTALSIIESLPDEPGYERSCSTGAGCVFGPAWTDNSIAPGSHNGCDTRNDVLAAQLAGVTYKPGTHNCKVLSGTLHDPYTGSTIHFTSSQPNQIQIDHIFPLARAWGAGAAHWSVEQRTAFANDIDSNLLAVGGRANQSKSDQGLDTWIPPNASYVCEYVCRYLSVAARYRLAITRGEASSASTACPAPRH